MLLCALLIASSIAFAQTGSISGKVVDETNQPMPSATVLVKGTTKSTSADVNGNFKLTGLTNGTVTLEIRFLGYLTSTQVVNLNGTAVVNVSMRPNTTSLNEVVVIGYGTVKSKDLTGSITNITAKDFNQGAITTPEQLIQGKVAGVSIISNGGAPGAGSTIRIRGGASVAGSNDPLFVIDGVPVSNNGIAGAANPLDLINPNDIESFSILKDASAAAIYGNRASNGVIIITTKKGQSGKPQVNFSSQISFASLPKEAPVLTADEFRAYVKANDTTSSKKYISLLGNASTDWQKEIYQNSVSTDNNISISGKTGKLPYRVSVGYLDQNGILITTAMHRYSTAINLSPSLFSDHLKVNFNFKGAQDKHRYANEGGAIYGAVDFNPTVPVFSGNSKYGGYWEWLDPANTATGLKSLAPLNPVGLLNENDNESTVYRALTSLALDYKLHFFPDLHVNVNVSYDGSNGSGSDFIPGTAASNLNSFTDANNVLRSGNNSSYHQVNGNTLFEGYLNYTKDIKSIKSHIDLVGGYSFQDFKTTNYSYVSYSADGVLNPSSVSNYPSHIAENQLTSIYARLNYAYNDKYLLTATIRSDISTRFAPGIRTGNFPAVALGWRISNEDFLKNSKTISNLKLRLEYGVTGNQDGIGNYDYLSPYSLSNTTAQYQFGSNYYELYRPSAYYPGRTWEQTSTSNLGIDYGFLNDRITGAIDVYYRKTDKLLASENQAAGSNFGNRIVGNIGNMTDKGVEFSINGRIIDQKAITWTAGFNVTYDKNEITNLTQIPNPDFGGILTTGISGGTGNTIQINALGYPKYSFYTFQQVYGSDGKPLAGVFVDRNKDGIINNADEYIGHSPAPQEFFGVNSDFRYKKASIGFSARASVGNYAYNNVASSTGVQRNFLNPIGVLNNGSRDVLTSGLTGNGSNDLLSDYYIQNASFFRMDNIHVGYNFGKVFRNHGDLRLSGSVQNVFIITNYTGVDPEISNGVDNNFYPRPRTFVLGFNLGL